MCTCSWAMTEAQGNERGVTRGGEHTPGQAPVLSVALSDL